ncbi:MAG: protein kinase [Myxococcota bacterium]
MDETGTRFASLKAAPRCSVLAPVVPRNAAQRPSWSTVNISETGLFVSGVPLLRPGAEVDVDIVLPSTLGPSLEITSRVQVVWTRERSESSRNRPPGMGMRFLGIDPRLQAELKAYVAELSTQQGGSRPRNPMAARETPPPPPFEASTPPVAVPPPPPREVSRTVKKGDTLGRYTILDRIGAGGMGEVFLAQHTALGRRVAVKVLKDEHAHDPAALRRFYDEARLVNQISHDNIVQITDLVVGEDHAFIVMELLVGPNLSQELLRKGPLPLSRIVVIGQQLCSALDAVHRAGIVHRDLKLQNIMLVNLAGTPDFVKLLDFGIAKLRRGAPVDRPQTVAGEVVGSPGFMAPEQLMGEPVDARTDIYSLGVVMFAMLTGQLPFKASGWAEMIVRQIQDTPRPPSTVAGIAVPKTLDNMVVRCLDRNPNNRPGSALAIATVLQHLM